MPADFFDDYPKWLGICFALKKEGEQYFDTFDEFSSQSDKYEGRDDCWNKWNSIKDEYRGNPITIGSIIHHARENGWQWPDQVAVTQESAEERYPSMSLDELLVKDFKMNYIIEDFLIEAQPCIIGGPPKALKTMTLLDAAYNLSIGGKFLGEFQCQQRRVLVMTGESGLAAIKQTLQAMIECYEGELPEDGYFHISEALPKFASESDIEALRLKMRQQQTEVVFIDPAYLTMGGADAANIQSQGVLLRAIGDMCREEGVTLVLAHHVTKEAAKKTGQTLELSDLVWAGFGEWTRQWWMINRQSKYVVGSGKHELRVNVGNSSRYSSVWIVDIDEGTKDDPCWDTSVTTADESKAISIAQNNRLKLKVDCDRVIAVMGREEFANGRAKTVIGEACGFNSNRTTKVLSTLLDDGRIEEIPGPRKNSLHYVLVPEDDRSECVCN